MFTFLFEDPEHRYIKGLFTSEEEAKIRQLKKKRDKVLSAISNLYHSSDPNEEIITDYGIMSLRDYVIQFELDGNLKSQQQLLNEQSQLDEKITEIIQNAFDRFVESFADNPNSVFDQIYEIIQGITKQDYIEYQKDIKNPLMDDFKGYYTTELDLLLKKKQECEEQGIPFNEEDSKRIRDLRKGIRQIDVDKRQGYQNCYYFLLSCIRDYLYIIEKYRLDDTLALAIVRKRAADFYKPTKNAIEAQKTIESQVFEKDPSQRWISYIQDPHQNDIIEADKDEFKYNQIAGTVTFNSQNGYTRVTISNDDMKRILSGGIEVVKVFDIAAGKFDFKKFTKITLDEFMAAFPNLKTRSYAREKMSNACNLISSMHITGYRKFDGKMVKEAGYNFFSWQWGDKQHNVIEIEYSKAFLERAEDLSLAPFPVALYSKPETAYLLGRKINNHKHMNQKKINEDIISVKALLNASNIKIPKDQHIKRLVIDPFENGLDECSDVFTWEYFKDGEIIPKEIVRSENSSFFFSLNIRVHFIDYPVEGENKRLSTKAKIEKKRGNGRKKK